MNTAFFLLKKKKNPKQRIFGKKLMTQLTQTLGPKTETDGFSTISIGFRLRLLKTENFCFGWPDEKKTDRIEPIIALDFITSLVICHCPHIVHMSIPT